MAGQVIGINTAIITGGRGNEGVGFALPSNTAIGVYNQLIANGKSHARFDRRELHGNSGQQSDRSQGTGRAVRDRAAKRRSGKSGGKGRFAIRRRHHERERQTSSQRQRPGQSDCGHTNWRHRPRYVYSRQEGTRCDADGRRSQQTFPGSHGQAKPTTTMARRRPNLACASKISARIELGAPATKT